MKKVIKLSFILFLFVQSGLAQKVNYDLYITICPESGVKIVRSSSSTENLIIYLLPLKDCNAVDYDIKINEKGNLITSIKVKGRPAPFIKLTYLNINQGNPPIIISKDQNLNTLSYNKHFNSENSESLLKLLKKAKNLYIIEKNCKTDKQFFIAKKVSFDVL